MRAEAPQRWYRRKRGWGLVLLAALVGWWLMPLTFSAGNVHVWVHGGGTPGQVAFVVRDAKGGPRPGVRVMSESSSGTTAEVATDTLGRAAITPGESEVLAVYVNGREVRFYPRCSWREFFAPSCSGDGLRLEVFLREE